MAVYSTLAAVDLGSNSFHLQAARVVSDQIYPLDALREPIRLGAGLTRDKRLDDDSQQRALECLQRFGERLRAHTARTLATQVELRKELAQVRQQGYAVNRGEWRETVGGLAAPIFDAHRRPLAAIGISGPVERLRPPQLKTFTPEVLRAAREISEALGYTAQ